MVTYINRNTRAKYAGNSIDEKPLNVQNGSVYFEIDTGSYYMFDAENKVWLLQEDNATGGGGSGTTDHSKLANRGKANQHPIKAITGLQEALNKVDEINKPIHTTLSVEVTEDGFGGYNAFHGLEKINDAKINNHRNADGVVFCYYHDVTKNITYTYWYSNMESDRMPTFTRSYIENNTVKQVLISIDNKAKAHVEIRQVQASVSPEGMATKNVNFDGHSLTGVQKFATNGPAPLFIGSTVESKATNAPRITAATDGSLAIVKADTVDKYVPLSVGDPMDADHAVTKRYLDGAYKTEMINYLKSPEGKKLIKDIVAGNV